MNNEQFIKGVERLVRPVEVGSVHFFQGFTGRMPVWLQRRFMKTAEKKSPYMGFVVEPYSLFLFFELVNINKAKKLLPGRFSLIKSKAHKKDTPKYYGIIGSFNAHTGGFWGARQETYVIAEDEDTGLLTWVIIGIETNTISFEPKTGLQGPNAKKSVVTQDAKGNIIVDIELDDKSRQLDLVCKTVNGDWVKLDQRLWLEGNLSVIYGGDLGRDGSRPFSLIFDPEEVARGISIPLKDLKINKNTIARGVFARKPSQIITFPYSQHFVSDSPTSPKAIKNKKELLVMHKKLKDLSSYQAFSLKTMKVGLAITIFFSSLISTISVALLIFHYILSH